MIRFNILGRIGLCDADGNEIRSVLTQPKRLALLAFLASAPGGFHRRDSLVSLFWPESSADAARASLRTALSVLRRALGDHVILTRGNEEVGIDAARLWCDAVGFQSLCTGEGRGAAELESALELYQGDLLAGFHIGDAPEFEHWLDEWRADLRREAAAVARRLAEREEQRGGHAAAAQWARRAVSLAPYDEGALRRLIVLLDQAGDRSGALRAYEEFAGQLHNEHEAEPSPETKALMRRVRTREQLPVPAVSAEAGTTIGLEPAAAPPDSAAVLPTSSEPPSTPETAPAPPPPVQPRRIPSRRRMANRIAVAGVVVILGLTLASLAFAPAPGATLVPQRVLIVPFENRTGDPTLDPLGSMAADWITQGIAETGLVEVVSSNTMLASWSHVGVEPDRPHSAAQYHALAEETGAGTLVTGTFYLQSDSLRYHVLVTDVGQGRVLRTMEPVAGPAGAPLDAVEVLRTRVMGVLATLFDQRMAMTTAGASRPPTFESYRAYLEGTERFIRLAYAEAIPFYELSAALDPSFAHPRIFAAICLHNIGHLERADSIARTLDGERHSLSSFDVHLLDWLLAWNRGERVAALEAIRRATDLMPTSEWLYVHSLSANQANRPAESVAALRRLDPGRGYMRGFVGYWADLTASLHVLGQHRRELRAAQQAQRQYPQDIFALGLEVRALAALGRVRDVERRLEQSLLLPPKQGVDPGRMMRVAASELRAHGRPEAAARILGDAIAWYDSRQPAERRSVGVRTARAQTLYLAGRWDEARAEFSQLAAEQPANLDHLGHLGVIAVRLGNHAEAGRIDAVLAASDRPFLHGVHLYWRARIAAAAGDSESAVHLLRESFTGGRPSWGGLHLDMDFEPLRDYAPFRELLRPKG